MLKKSLKTRARKLSETQPELFRIARSAYQRFQYLRAYARSRLASGEHDVPAQTVLTVPLDRIRFGNFDATGNRILPVDAAFHGVATVKAGDWDLQQTVIERMPIYRAVRNYLLNGTDIRTSDYYGGRAAAPDLITTGAWHRVYEQNLPDVVARFESLYRSIREHGYRSQAEMGTDRPLDEIALRVGRRGELLFENSLHRLIVAKLLGVSVVPAVVTVRHTDWMQTRRQFHEFARMRQEGRLYGKLPHPDLADVPHSHECDDRIQMIEPHISHLPQGNALDLGADLGNFSRMLDRLGFQTTAVERDGELAHYTRLLKDIEGSHFNVMVADILSSEVQNEIRSKKYSVVLALNIFHHFLKTEKTFHGLCEMLNNLDMDAMVFQAHRTDEPQMQQAFLNPLPDEFAAIIMGNSRLRQMHPIGPASDGRQIFFLTKAEPDQH
jgi:2-polyprenyl-3-methyl-5-hydroxy-6-metoxy-1,4-benzoquinol methylase